MSARGFLFGIVVLVGLGWVAMREGSKEGELMAKCVNGQLESLNQYMESKKVAYRIAIYACREYNRDGIVKMPAVEG
jgi:hypothetical protein